MKFDELEDDFFEFRYSLSSGAGCFNAKRYLNEYKVEIYTEPDEPLKPVLVGKAYFSVILISSIVNNGFSLLEVFDESAALMDFGEEIYDFSIEEFNEETEEYFRERTGHDILFLENIEILPPFRGKNLGSRLIKDIYLRFTHGCCMFALKAFPIQCEGWEENLEYKFQNDWQRKMGYGSMDRDFEKNSYKLYAYYQRLGFHNFLGNEYFFLNPDLRNERMDAIEFH